MVTTSSVAIVRTPYTTRNPEIPESAFQSPKNAILAPQENGPEKSIKWSENTRQVHLNAPKRHFSDHLIDFSGPFSWGGQNRIFRTLKCTFWNFRISGSVWGPDDRNSSASFRKTRGVPKVFFLIKAFLSLSVIRCVPCPSFPCFLGIPCFFFPCEEFLVFFLRSSLLFQDFGGSLGIKQPCFVVVFRAFFKRKQGKEGQGVSLCDTLRHFAHFATLYDSLRHFGTLCSERHKLVIKRHDVSFRCAALSYSNCHFPQ